MHFIDEQKLIDRMKEDMLREIDSDIFRGINNIAKSLEEESKVKYRNYFGSFEEPESYERELKREEFN